MPKSQTSRPNQNQPSFIMENLGFHKSKLYSLILAGVGLISMLLPWISLGGFGSKNGFGGWGLLVLVGVGVSVDVGVGGIGVFVGVGVGVATGLIVTITLLLLLL